MEAKILRVNMSGQAVEWLNWKQATTLYARELVLWSMGGVVKRVRGGRSRFSGRQSYIDLPAILACGGRCSSQAKTTHFSKPPPLSNQALFFRDESRCLYCGHYFSSSELSRDHVVPTSRGGPDRWENVVAACKRCNQRKGNYLLEEIDMQLLALPYLPNPYEYLALINSDRMRGDQMAYLRPRFKHYCGRLIDSRGASFSLAV
ncbi:HNH endonuclease [Agaribacterium sp. ZY112]|uniref:HNH endonuclease n=1 Tax=Agaribacterium sp. ZY112 TaxID=3233574 RepID=UPI0035261B99